MIAFMRIPSDVSFEEFSKAFQVVPRDQAIETIGSTLKMYELKYHMSSYDFYKMLASGRLEESFDYGLWKSKIDTYCYHRKITPDQMKVGAAD